MSEKKLEGSFCEVPSENIEFELTKTVSLAQESKALKCFVMMPFGSSGEYLNKNKESNYIYKKIVCPGIDKFKKMEGIDVKVIREVDRNVSGSITRGILKNIALADICIVDITGRNPNVFFELGIRYSLRPKITILLKQEETEIPFDIRGYRCLTYDCLEPDPAINSLAEFLTSGLKDIYTSDSLVFETFQKMRVSIPGILTSVRDERYNILSWDDWWARLLELVRLLKDPAENGRFLPEAVMGISNGGLILADFLGREVFKATPILSLWANRTLDAKSRAKSTCYYFDNEYNKSLVKVIKEKNKNEITILLTDDLVYTSNTVGQATTFLKRELGENCRILFTPLFCRDTDSLDSISEMLPYEFDDGNIFNISKQEYFESVTCETASFPYRKALGYGG